MKTLYSSCYHDDNFTDQRTPLGMPPHTNYASIPLSDHLPWVVQEILLTEMTQKESEGRAKALLWDSI